MARRSLRMEEWWPVFGLAPEGDGWNDEKYTPLEFTDNEMVDIKRVAKEFAEWQREIGRRFGAEPGYYNEELIAS